MAEYFLKASMMSDISFRHCPRDAKHVGHQLAKNSYISKELLVWDGDTFSFMFPYAIPHLTILSN
jgi:hypothetical protein